MNELDDGLPIEEFIQALTSQLDRAQAAMALKARFGLPLTFAVKEITIDLRAQVDMVRSQVRIRPAGPNDKEASVLHLSLTTITRPMMEENTLQFKPDEPSLKEVLGDEVTDEERRRLEWAGIHNLSQLREMQRQSGEHAVEQVVQIPALRLRTALERAARPHISAVTVENNDRLRIRGRNLMQAETPQVRLDDQPVQVLEASENEIVTVPFAHALGATLIVETAPGVAVEAIVKGASR